MIEGHGDDLWRFGGKIRHNFSTNIHAAFDHSSLMAMLADSVETLRCYPEPKPLSVEKAISFQAGCSPQEVIVTNGATDAIYLIAKEFSGCQSAIVSPTFSEYQDACMMHCHTVSLIDSISMIPEECDIVWLCNPNNPTGQAIPKEKLLAVIARYPGKKFIIDQAYSDYSAFEPLHADEAVNARNVLLLGSLTKRFGVPGLRIGYAIGNSELIASIKRWRMPWSVNGFATKGALHLLADISRYRIDADGLHKEALRISDEFRRMGITVTPTDCNFILCRLPKGTAAELKHYLVKEAGILIRDASNFSGLDEKCFRVAAQTPEENDLLIENVRKYTNMQQSALK